MMLLWLLMFCVVDVQTAVDFVLLVDVVHVVDVHAAGARPKNRNRTQKQLLWLSKKNPWVQRKNMHAQKNLPTRSRKHTGKSPTLFLPLGP